MNPWSLVLGAVVTGVLSHYVVPLVVKYIEDQVQEQMRDSNDTVGAQLAGGNVLGYLECALFFGSLVWAGGVALIAAWLVFKTVAKWKTWDSVGKVPLTEIQMRYRVFVIGTAANIVAALAGVAVAHLP